MKVVTLTDKEEKILRKLLDKKMKSMHEKYKLVEKDMVEHEIIKHNKKMAAISNLKDRI
ncbi:MAG TPA: hypothetical protein VF691_06470 [Cytophagaceae bacterium]|jgi:hypothetical protein